MLNVQKLSFAYGDKITLSDITFEAETGTRIAVLGPNGAGKSTLFRCILGLLPRYDGTIRMTGRDIRTMTAAELARCAAYIPQSTAPVFDYTVLEMVLMGTTGQLGPFSGPGKRQAELAQAVLQSLGVDSLASRSFSKISGGERQLALVARAMVQGVKLLIKMNPRQISILAISSGYWSRWRGWRRMVIRCCFPPIILTMPCPVPIGYWCFGKGKCWHTAQRKLYSRENC